MLVLLPYLEYSISIKIHCCLSHNKSARVFVQSPNSVGLPSENIALKTVDGYTIVAYFIKQPPDRVGKACTMLYFHGNAGNIGHRLHNAQALYQHCGVNILVVEYRGMARVRELLVSLVSVIYVTGFAKRGLIRAIINI